MYYVHVHLLFEALLQRRYCSNCIRSPVTSVVVKADLKRMANSNSVKRTEIGRAGVTIKPGVNFANIKS